MRPSLFARPFSPKNRLAGESAQCRILFATRTYRRRLPSACATRRVLIRFSKDEERAKSLRQTALAATQSTKISNLPFLRRKKYAALGYTARGPAFQRVQPPERRLAARIGCPTPSAPCFFAPVKQPCISESDRPRKSMACPTFSLGGQFVHQPFGIVELAQSLGHGGGVDGYGAVGGSVVDEIAHQGFDVAVEDQAYDFTLRIDDRRSRIAADDVVGGDEIERRGQVEFIAAFLVAGGQVERSLIVEAGGAVV